MAKMSSDPRRRAPVITLPVRSRVVHRQDLRQAIGMDRLHEVGIEAGLAGAVRILGQTVAGDGDQAQLSRAAGRSKVAGDFVTVEPRKTDVDARDIRLELER